MGAIITSIGGISTYVISLVTDVASTIVATPILLIPLGLGLLGSGVALFKGLR